MGGWPVALCLTKQRRAVAGVCGVVWGTSRVVTVTRGRKALVTWRIWSDCSDGVVNSSCPSLHFSAPLHSTGDSFQQAFEEAQGERQGTGLRAPASITAPFPPHFIKQILPGGKSDSFESPIAVLSMLYILHGVDREGKPWDTGVGGSPWACVDQSQGAGRRLPTCVLSTIEATPGERAFPHDPQY